MRYWTIIILSFLSCLAEAQKIDMQFADRLLDKELAFFASAADSEKISLLIDKAELYKGKADYKMALSELGRAEKISPVQSARIRYEKMLNYFLSGNFKESSAVILSSEELLRMNRSKEYFLMRFASLNETGQWGQCKKELLNYCPDCDSLMLQEVNSLPVSYDYVDPFRCGKLSGWLPGLGMARAGKPFKGATSFLLQAGLVAGTVYCFYSGYYVAGVVSGIFPLMKFHKGGNRLSAILAEDRNDREKEKVQARYAEEIKKVVHP